jgi:hypothetical protein
MSKVTQLKSELQSVAQEARQTAGNIEAFDAKFSKAISEVQGLIGGTATKADKQIMEVLTSASKAVKAAAESLRAAAKTAQDYGNSI